MIKVNIVEIKAKLSEYLDRVEGGEQIVICRRNRPVAELRPIETTRTEPRPIGGFEGQIVIPPSFFDPLPDDVVDDFYGGGGAARQRPRVAEEPARYEATRRPPSKRGPRA